MSDHNQTYKLINMLERSPKGQLKFEEDGVKTVCFPPYILQEDVERIIKLLEADEPPALIASHQDREG